MTMIGAPYKSQDRGEREENLYTVSTTLLHEYHGRSQVKVEAASRKCQAAIVLVAGVPLMLSEAT